LATSSSLNSGLIGVTTPPSAATAWNATAQSAPFGPSRPTASPAPMPAAASPDAVRATWSAKSA
jgi:hypothetical protein